VFERFLFNTAAQELGEMIDAYVTRLRHLASSCKFVAGADCLSYENSMIRDRLILGTSDTAAGARAFRERYTDLDKTVATLRSSELASKQLRVIGQHSADMKLVHFTSSKESKAKTGKVVTSTMKDRPLTKSSCKYCGKQHEPGKCPTYGKQCKNCLKQNHFASVCKSECRVNQFVTYSSDDSDVDTTNDFFIGNVTCGSKSILRVVKMLPPQLRG